MIILSGSKCKIKQTDSVMHCHLGHLFWKVVLQFVSRSFKQLITCYQIIKLLILNVKAYFQYMKTFQVCFLTVKNMKQTKGILYYFHSRKYYTTIKKFEDYVNMEKDLKVKTQDSKLQLSSHMKPQ